MVTMTVVVLCIASEGFMLHCLSHFGREVREGFRRESAAGLWTAAPKSKFVPLQFSGRTRIVSRSEKEHYKAAA